MAPWLLSAAIVTFQHVDKQPSRAWEVNQHAKWTETRMQELQFSLKDDVSSLSSFPPLTCDTSRKL